MGRWRHTDTSDDEYQRYRARYLKTRDQQLARAKEYYRTNRPALLVKMEQVRDALRDASLLKKSRAFRAGKPGYAKQGKRLERARQFIKDNKTRPCYDCKQSFPPCAMDFDHVQGEKRGDVSQMASRGVSLTILKREIAKCDCVCANCHRIRTYTRAQV